jgi:transcriptional regulator with XRE-family HTH domain
VTRNFDPPPVGRVIRARRLERGLSQAVLSRRARIHASYLSRIETGKVHPTAGMAMRIATGLDVSLNDLLEPPGASKDRPCPIMPSGRCLLELLDNRGQPAVELRGETISPRQLRLIRQFAALVQQSHPDLLKALEVLLPKLTADTIERP